MAIRYDRNDSERVVDVGGALRTRVGYFFFAEQVFSFASFYEMSNFADFSETSDIPCRHTAEMYTCTQAFARICM